MKRTDMPISSWLNLRTKEVSLSNNSNFLIPRSLQPNGANLDINLKLRVRKFLVNKSKIPTVQS